MDQLLGFRFPKANGHQTQSIGNHGNGYQEYQIWQLSLNSIPEEELALMFKFYDRSSPIGGTRQPCSVDCDSENRPSFASISAES